MTDSKTNIWMTYFDTKPLRIFYCSKTAQKIEQFIHDSTNERKTREEPEALRIITQPLSTLVEKG